MATANVPTSTSLRIMADLVSRLGEHAEEVADLEAKLREALEILTEVLDAIQSARMVSIGSIDSHYNCQMYRPDIEKYRAFLDGMEKS